jgi:ankyrin repeat protein
LHRFGWISLRLDALATLGENIPSKTSDILEEVGSPRDEEFAQALQGIPEGKYGYAFRLFQCLVAAIRPLSLKELADISAELDPNADPVHSAYPALIALRAADKDGLTTAQFSHESVKEFLTSNRLRTSSIEDIPRYHFSLKAAHATLARVCINVLLRFDQTADKAHLKERSPLALYAAQYWVQHTEQGNAATENQDVMKSLFDPSKTHLEAWIWMHDVDKGQSRTMESLADHPSPSQRSATPLYYAALCGFTELVEYLAKSPLREDPHGRHDYHSTPLHAASYKGHNDVVLALINCDRDDLKRLDKKVDNKTPLHAAFSGGQLETMKLLLDKGADVNAKGASGNTLLHCASLRGRLDEVKLLLKGAYRADLNAKNKNGWTPLHRAALRGQVKVAEYLLNFKDEDDNNPEVLVDINAQSNNKNTPLHVASIAGKLEIVDLLLDHDADKKIKGEHGWIPLEAADENKHEKIVERLSRGEHWWGAWGSELRRRGGQLTRKGGELGRKGGELGRGELDKLRRRVRPGSG